MLILDRSRLAAMSDAAIRKAKHTHGSNTGVGL